MTEQPGRILTSLAVICWGTMLLGLILIQSGQVLDPVLTPRLFGLALSLSFVGFLAVLLPFTSLSKQLPLLSYSPVGMVCLVLVCLTGLALFGAQTLVEGIHSWWRWWIFFGLFMVSSWVSRFPQSKQWAGRMALFALVGISLYAFWQAREIATTEYTFSSFELDRFVEAGFTNTNVFSSVLVMLFPFGFAVLRSDSIFWRVFALIALALGMLALLSQGSKVASVVAGLMVGVAVLLELKHWSHSLKKTHPTRKRLWRGVWILLGLAGIGICFSPIGAKLWNATAFVWNFNTQNEIRAIHPDSSLFERALMLNNSWQMIQEQPFTGVGLSDWPLEMSRAGVGGSDYINQGTVRYMRPHNDFIQLWCETGLGGMIAYLSLFLLALIRSWKVFKNAKEKRDSTWAGATIVALLAFFLLSCFYFPAERPYLLLLFAIWLGIGESLHPASIYSKKKHLHFGLASLLLVIGLVGSYWLSSRLKAEKHLFALYQAKFEQNWEMSLAAAAALDGRFASRDYLATPVKWYEGQAWFQLNQLDRAKEAYENALLINPYHLDTHNDLAGVLNLQGRLKDAEKSYQTALAFSPCFSRALRNCCITRYQQGDLEGAIGILCIPCYATKLNQKEDRKLVLTLMQTYLKEAIEKETDTQRTAQMQQLHEQPEQIVKWFREMALKGVFEPESMF